MENRFEEDKTRGREETSQRLFQYSNRDLTSAVVKRMENKNESEKYLEEECFRVITN